MVKLCGSARARPDCTGHHVSGQRCKSPSSRSWQLSSVMGGSWITSPRTRGRLAIGFPICQEYFDKFLAAPSHPEVSLWNCPLFLVSSRDFLLFLPPRFQETPPFLRNSLPCLLQLLFSDFHALLPILRHKGTEGGRLCFCVGYRLMDQSRFQQLSPSCPATLPLLYQHPSLSRKRRLKKTTGHWPFVRGHYGDHPCACCELSSAAFMDAPTG